MTALLLASARPPTRARRPGAIQTAVALMMVVLSALAIPAAHAQETQTEEFGTDFVVGFGESCPDGATFVGDIAGVNPLNGSWCRPAGYAPVTDFNTCTASGSAIWSPNESVCSWIAWGPPQTPTCPGPAVFIENGLSTVDGSLVVDYQACAMPVLQLAAGLNSDATYPTPACIESDLVQTSDTAQGGQVGVEFLADDGNNYVIHYGAPSCEFDCVDGFDINCDGVLGDYCPVEIDRRSASGAAACLAITTPLAAAADSAASVALSAPPAPAAGLAHTATETSVLAYLGLGLAGFGALALGARRRLGHD